MPNELAVSDRLFDIVGGGVAADEVLAVKIKESEMVKVRIRKRDSRSCEIIWGKGMASSIELFGAES
jgi:hypothetical protein